ncbi:hypothetical protein CKO28_00700 [Rhodovibrio sodomensis]|uniref:Uncharacterized protein n=1 Tax=Rhodovibrio sodomensis TaxID=1088 RepID=A0ABS1DAV7_9PROT|nr:hypothetical protein [Rhodovibrio sodomensis]MBK1666560.1 hypothetical protein [Rhodovibrio sodomensis]
MPSDSLAYPDYPPRNRQSEELPLFDLRIEDANESHAFDPNGLIGALVEDRLPLGGPTVGPSDISGRPALRYRELDLAALLTPDELRRLVSLALHPDEYFVLRDRYGLFYSIHHDFYAPETGEALQPRFE